MKCYRFCITYFTYKVNITDIRDFYFILTTAQFRTKTGNFCGFFTGLSCVAVMTVQDFFMISRNTNNIYCRKFSQAKRIYLASNVYKPKKMMEVIQESAKTSSYVASIAMSWKSLKNDLEKYFTISQYTVKLK